MKQLFSVFLGLLYFGLSAQQTHWLNPKPTGGIFHDIEFFDQSHGLMCGEDGTICGTEDGGATWDIVFNNGRDLISQINIISTSKALLLCGSSEIIGTDDYGSTWYKCYRLPDSLKSIRFKMLSEDEGHLLVQHRQNEKFYIGQCTDGAENWTFKSLADLMGETLDIRDFAFQDMGKGIFLIYKEEARIYRTFDSCKTFAYNGYEEYWGFSSAENTPSGIYIIGYIRLKKMDGESPNDSQTPYQCDGVIWRTKDNGITLEESYQVVVSPRLKEIKHMGDSCIYAFGDCNFHIEEPCHILPVVSSMDAGESWELNETIPSNFEDKGYFWPRITALGIKNESESFLCMAAGDHYELFYFFKELSVLLQTKTATQWSPLPGNYTDGFNSLVFLDNGMYLSSRSTLLKYNGKPALFDTVSIGGYRFWGAAQYDGSTASWIAWDSDDYGRINMLFTDDCGQNWEKIDTNILYYPNSISFPDPNHLYLFQYNWDIGANKMLIRLDINAKLFNELPLPDDPNGLKYMIFTRGEGYLFGGQEYNGGYYKTNDEGENWEFTNLRLRFPVHHALQVNDSIFILELGDYVYKSDAQESEIWKINCHTGQRIEMLYSGNEMGELYDMLLDANGQLYTLCREGIFILRYDGVWEKWDNLPDLNGLTLDPDGQHVWAYGSSGRLLYIGDGLPVGVAPKAKIHPQSFTVYGNPFSDNLEIKVNIAYKGETVFQITDLSGRLVQRNKLMLYGGASQFLINTQNLPAGAYICTLISDKKRFSQRVVKY